MGHQSRSCGARVMTEPTWRRVRMCLALGGERRVTEVQIRADTIPADGWRLLEDGTWAHDALTAYARQWALDQLEVRAFTPRDGGSQTYFNLDTPHSAEQPAVQRASENTRTPPSPPTPEQLCDRCGGELEEPLEDWQQPADAWRHK